jgi:hypothetical protein
MRRLLYPVGGAILTPCAVLLLDAFVTLPWAVSPENALAALLWAAGGAVAGIALRK